MKRNLLPVFFIFIFLVSSCNKSTPTAAQPTETATAIVTPTATSIPMALRVNGEGITLVEYEAELIRLQQAQTTLELTSTPEEQKTRVLQNFQDELLLSQAAAQSGYTVDDATLQARIDKLVSEIGGTDKLSSWQAANGYTDETFRTALRRAILVAWQRDQIINSVPTTADQVHARQILFQDEANANAIYQQLESGVDFATLASTYDPTLGGDLGWFPQGTLTQPEVESAAFALQPGEYSEVIPSAIGYHIIYVIERDAEHELSVDARRTLQEKAIADWLEASKAVSTIEVLVP